MPSLPTKKTQGPYRVRILAAHTEPIPGQDHLLPVVLDTATGYVDEELRLRCIQGAIDAGVYALVPATKEEPREAA